jgi:hypothetical protein
MNLGKKEYTDAEEKIRDTNFNQPESFKRAYMAKLAADATPTNVVMTNLGSATLSKSVTFHGTLKGQNAYGYGIIELPNNQVLKVCYVNNENILVLETTTSYKTGFYKFIPDNGNLKLKYEIGTEDKGYFKVFLKKIKEVE